MKLGTKLVLFSLVLLALPWLGYRYVGEIQSFLLQGQEKTQQLAVQALATVLQGRDDLLGYPRGLDKEILERGVLYAHRLRGPLQLDGYDPDWGPLAEHMARGQGVRWQLGVHGRTLYVLLQVTDDRLVYRHPGFYRLDTCDHLRLSLPDGEGGVMHLLLATEGPGSMRVFHVGRRWRYPDEDRRIHSLEAQWQETADGYRVEIRMPLELLGPDRRLRLEVADVDDADRRRLVSVRPLLPTGRLDHLVVRSAELQEMLAGAVAEDARVWVVDRYGRVRGGYGGSEIITELSADRLGPVLQGKAGAWRRGAEYSEEIIAAHPVRADGRVIGAVVLEQGVGEILSLQRITLLRITAETLAVLLLLVIGLLLFATRLAWRIRRLGNETAAAIDAEGRIRASLIQAERKAGDELGGLSRRISELLGRLRRYTGFLESVPRTLRHEINNPLNVISTSLQNLADAHPEMAGDRYLQSAGRGVARLEGIVHSLTEAAGLEQSLQQDERVELDLAALVSAYVDGCSQAHPGRRLVHAGPEAGVIVRATDFRIEQLLDKLVDNALDFTPEDGEIRVELEAVPGRARLSVSNDGPPLPEAIRGCSFDSMVSVREARAGDRAHLGMGLYVAALIAESHGGSLCAGNRPGGGGAVFRLELPRLRGGT
jgi:signal transduction histidine kinase